MRDFILDPTNLWTMEFVGIVVLLGLIVMITIIIWIIYIYHRWILKEEKII